MYMIIQSQGCLDRAEQHKATQQQHNSVETENVPALFKIPIPQSLYPTLGDILTAKLHKDCSAGFTKSNHQQAKHLNLNNMYYS